MGLGVRANGGTHASFIVLGKAYKTALLNYRVSWNANLLIRLSVCQ